MSYKQLNELDASLGPKGLQILAFPSNEFGGQEPYDDATIQANAANPESKTFATFPVFNKIHVNGATADPLYKYLNTAAPGLLGTTFIKWNFAKYLCDKDGHVLHRYATTTAPNDIRPDIEALL